LFLNFESFGVNETGNEHTSTPECFSISADLPLMLSLGMKQELECLNTIFKRGFRGIARHQDVLDDLTDRFALVLDHW
jgi:hypothetical protein